jgi:peroxiredoxin Q/BCP
MALKEGTQAPNFTLPSTAEQDFTLAERKGKPLVLFFYPKDFTSVCTAEACSFRDQFSVFRDLNVEVIGISRDDIPTHNRFKAQYNLPFELLADTEGKVSKLYKATLPLVGMSARITYLLDEDHTVRAAFKNLFSAEQHIAAMLEALQKK